MATTDTDTHRRCHRCERLSRRLVAAYWGELLCPDCCQLAATINDLGDWPPLPDADVGG